MLQTSENLESLPLVDKWTHQATNKGTKKNSSSTRELPLRKCRNAKERVENGENARASGVY
jgi:hypothetical protein